ncbi:hypothetical protein FB446DRAFT_710184, partial [Lentinula raphanica]
MDVDEEYGSPERLGTRGPIVKQRHADMDSNGERDDSRDEENSTAVPVPSEYHARSTRDENNQLFGWVGGTTPRCPSRRFSGYEHDKSHPIPTSACRWKGSLYDPPKSPNSLLTSVLSVPSPDIAAKTSSGTGVTVPANASTSTLSGLPLQDLPDPESISPLLSTAIDTDMDASSGTNVIVSTITLEPPSSSPVTDAPSNVSPDMNITVASIRSAFLQFMAVNHLLDSAAVAAGFSDSFVDGLVYCLLGHGIGIRQLTGTYDLERTIIMQQLDEAQVAQAAAETARD